MNPSCKSKQVNVVLHITIRKDTISAISHNLSIYRADLRYESRLEVLYPIMGTS